MMYRRLLVFLRPHAWRMVGTVTCNITFTLLVPFLDRLFKQPSLPSPISGLQQRIVGAFLDDANPQTALVNIVVVILAAVTLKNLFVWASGQLGAQLQEYVTRDLRNALYSHLQRLPLGFFLRTKTGDILARVLNDTQQTKQVITQAVTQSIQSAAIVITTIVVLLRMS